MPALDLSVQSGLFALFLGGVVLLVVDRMNLKPVYRDVERFPTRLYLQIGLFQCLSLIPGTSRSGSTIVGALLLGVDKRAATQMISED